MDRSRLSRRVRSRNPKGWQEHKAMNWGKSIGGVRNSLCKVARLGRQIHWKVGRGRRAPASLSVGLPSPPHSLRLTEALWIWSWFPHTQQALDEAVVPPTLSGPDRTQTP